MTVSASVFYNFRNNPLSEEERINWVRLIRTENVGPISFYELLHAYGSATHALEMVPELSRRGGMRRSIKIPEKGPIEEEMAKLRRRGGHLITFVDTEYPWLVRSLPDAPPVLSVLGNVSVLKERILAIVGARNASLNARRFTLSLAQDLGSAGYVVVSGFAMGIDREAHKGSFSTRSIAVVAGGVDIIYPKENEDLYEEILRHEGAIVAEMPLGFSPQARHFPRRNRLISGLALGVVVVEASLKSGSLITANAALEQNRDVFAVPGFPWDPRSWGTNHLLKQGAILVQTAHDVLDVYNLKPYLNAHEEEGTYARQVQINPSTDMVETAHRVLKEYLSTAPISIDDVVRHAGLDISSITMALLELELAGNLVRHSGNQVSLMGTLLQRREG